MTYTLYIPVEIRRTANSYKAILVSECRENSDLVVAFKLHANSHIDTPQRRAFELVALGVAQSQEIRNRARVCFGDL